MLRLPSHHNFSSVHTSGETPSFTDIPAEDDELLRAIEADHEQPWSLDATPDTTELSSFWSGVEDDLHNDPSWVSFSDDE